MEVCSVFCLAATRKKIFYHTQQGLKRKISRLVFKLFPRKLFALSKYSPVTLHYSPAPAILNETPALPVCSNMQDIFLQAFRNINFSPSDSTLACVSYSLEFYNYRNSSKCLKILAIIIFC